MFEKIQKIHLEEYLPAVIKQFGHAILHGDGNIYVDRPEVEEKHQASYLAKEFAAHENEGAKYRVRFTDVSQIPKSLQAMENLFISASAKEKADKDKIKEVGGTLTMDLPKVEAPETETVSQKSKPGPKPKAEKE
jgi:hypothetical protein